MNPGTLTSPVQGEVLSYAVRRRAEGAYYDVIAAELRTMTGKHITGPMVSAVVRRQCLPRLSLSKGLAPNADTASDVDAVQPIKDGGPATKWMAPAQAGATPNNLPAPVVHTTKSRAEAYLIISDLQIPYHHPGALEFCQRVRFEFGVPLENMICVGDEFDMYWMSRFEKSAAAPHTANQEVEAGRVEIARWIAAFPHMMICDSNHVKGRMVAAASRAGLASAFVRDVREVYNIPETWRWADHWVVKGSRHPFRVEHGNVGPGGHSGLRGRPLNRMISTAWGHEHSEPGVVHVNTHGGGRIWGMRTGSLLTTEPVAALSYNAEQGSRPVGSVGVVLDGGRTPLVVRM